MPLPRRSRARTAPPPRPPAPGSAPADRAPADRAPTGNAPIRAGADAAPPHLQDTVRLSATGLAKVLGDLEARVLRAVWDLGEPVPARTVFEHVIVEHPVSPLTVITVLNKLVHKRILTRALRDDLLHYRARMTEPEFMAHAARRMIEGVLSFHPDAMAASLVEVLDERDPARLATLARLVEARLAQRRTRDDAAGPDIDR